MDRSSPELAPYRHRGQRRAHTSPRSKALATTSPEDAAWASAPRRTTYETLPASRPPDSGNCGGDCSRVPCRRCSLCIPLPQQRPRLARRGPFHHHHRPSERGRPRLPDRPDIGCSWPLPGIVRRKPGRSGASLLVRAVCPRCPPFLPHPTSGPPRTRRQSEVSRDDRGFATPPGGCLGQCEQRD